MKTGKYSDNSRIICGHNCGSFKSVSWTKNGLDDSIVLFSVVLNIAALVAKFILIVISIN